MDANLPPQVHTAAERQIKVTAIGELSLIPDRCKVLYTLHSAKEQVQDVKNSVTRRMDYVIQTLMNHQVRVSFRLNHDTMCL